MDLKLVGFGLVNLGNLGCVPLEVVGVRPDCTCISILLPSAPVPRTPTSEMYEGNPKRRFQRPAADPRTRTSPSLNVLVPSGTLYNMSVLSSCSFSKLMLILSLSSSLILTNGRITR